MHFSLVKNALVFCLTGSVAFSAVIQKRDACSTAPTPPNPVSYGFKNHPGAHYYCDTRWDYGLVITGLEVWAEQYQIKGIRWTLSDCEI